MLSFFHVPFCFRFALRGQLSAALPQRPQPRDFHCNAAAHEPFLDQANRFILTTFAINRSKPRRPAIMATALRWTPSLTTRARRNHRRSAQAVLAGKMCFAAAKSNYTRGWSRSCAPPRQHRVQSLSLDVLQAYRYRPQDYVEMIGSGLFFPLTSTDGTEQARLSAVLARMEQIPRILEEARQNLKEADPVFIDTASMRTPGTPESSSRSGA
jgi:hypothetical protein